ncbi:MAG: ATP-binding protein [Candidatus Hydrogenedentota bacterium]|nr:MAG: ATP-binding protein [Candidatus Hydrogenedentota bacterium]
MVNREPFLQLIRRAFRRSQIVAILGPRQCGKTTLARQFVPPTSSNYFDLEDPASVAGLQNPKLVLERLKGIVVIDEIQRMPNLFPILRVLADRKPLPARFLILGSASPRLIQNASETLAGRIEFIELTPFQLREVSFQNYNKHWLRGGFPRAYLARSHEDAFSWLKNYVRTFIERDVPQLSGNVNSQFLMKFFFMIAHYHSNVFNAAELAKSLGISESTVRRYLDILTGVFMLRQLKPWHENLKKRQVKSPKVYIRDSGVLHYLLEIRNQKFLYRHPKLGASFEGYILEEILRNFPDYHPFFWATHAGAELDLLLIKGRKRYGFEIKLSDAPTLTKSMQIAMNDLKLNQLTVLYPGNRAYPLSKKIMVQPAIDFLKNMKL